MACEKDVAGKQHAPLDHRPARLDNIVLSRRLGVHRAGKRPPLRQGVCLAILLTILHVCSSFYTAVYSPSRLVEGSYRPLLEVCRGIVWAGMLYNLTPLPWSPCYQRWILYYNVCGLQSILLFSATSYQHGGSDRCWWDTSRVNTS